MVNFVKYSGKKLTQMREDYPDAVLQYKEYLNDFSVEELDVRIQHKTCNSKYDDWMLDLEKERYRRIKKESAYNKTASNDSAQSDKVEFVANEYGLMLPVKKTSTLFSHKEKTVFPKVDSLKWEDIKITFISHESVRISAKKINRQYHFIEIGFGNKHHPDIPSKRWEFLKEIARNGGIARPKDNLDVKVGIRNGVKAISDIRKTLRKFFNLGGEPFHPYAKVKAYKTIFILNHTLQD